MRVIVTFALSLAAAWVFAQGAPSDVPPGHWAHKAVDELYKAGVLQGYPEAKFMGDRSASHYEVAAALGKQAEKSSLDQKLAALKNDLTGIKSAMQQLQAQVRGLKKELADLKKQIMDLSSRAKPRDLTLKTLGWTQAATTARFLGSPEGANPCSE